MAAGPVYDSIGKGYARNRQADPRIAAYLLAALNGVRTVLNVGAGSGSYEPKGRFVVAVDPSKAMLTQRPRGSAPAVLARAEALPFCDRAFDAVLAVLTVHHWSDRAAGLAECVRTARERVVLFTWDPKASGFWLVQDYLPGFLANDRERFPTIEMLRNAFGSRTPMHVTTVPIPGDCMDGFLGAFWARPTAYLDVNVQAGISAFVQNGATEGLKRLRQDLESGEWHARYGELLQLDALDLGYRVVVAHVGQGKAA